MKDYNGKFNLVCIMLHAINSFWSFLMAWTNLSSAIHLYSRLLALA